MCVQILIYAILLTILLPIHCCARGQLPLSLFAPPPLLRHSNIYYGQESLANANVKRATAVHV